MEPAIRIGIDENGLGPRLGPLVVTAVVARTTGGGHERAEKRPRGAMRRAPRRLEEARRPRRHRPRRGVGARDRAADGPPGAARPRRARPRALARPAGDAARPVPRATTPRSAGAPRARRSPPTSDARRDGRSATSRKLEAQGVGVLRVACVVTCARRLNDGVARGLTRFHVDLHAMERLALEARERARAATSSPRAARSADSTGTRRRSGRSAGASTRSPRRARKRSEYAVPGLGRIAFVRDADEKHLLVSMASLVGKWVRDLLMARVVRYHRARRPRPARRERLPRPGHDALHRRDAPRARPPRPPRRLLHPKA